MRKDMSKVLTERPRTKCKYRRYSNNSERSIDDFQQKESMKLRHIERKSFSDLLGPLYRFIGSRVGKPWNDVYSEICQNLKPTSTLQQHLLDHVKTIVLTNVIVEGEFIRRPIDDRYLNVTSYKKYKLYYVDPTTGILCKAKIFPYEKPKKETTVISNGMTQYRLINKVWYVLELTYIPPVEETVVVKDSYHKEETITREHQPGYDEFLCSSLETLTKFGYIKDAFRKQNNGYPFHYGTKFKTIAQWLYGNPNFYCKAKYPAGRKHIKIIKQTIGTEQYDQSIKL
jgi:hypothetical protein